MRRLAVVVALTILATGCEYTEILRINRDNSAIIRVEMDLSREEHTDGLAVLDWQELENRSREFGTGGDDLAARRMFLTELLALDGTEEWLDYSATTLVLEVDEARLHLSVERKIADLSSTRADDPGIEESIILSQAEVSQSVGSVSLVSPARAAAVELGAELLAFEGDPYVDGADAGVDAFPLTISVEIEVPGDLDFSDAHERTGNTLGWSWEFGETGGPGLEVGWNPDPSPWSIDWSDRTTLIVVGLALLPLVGAVAAAFGLFEAWRVRRRDNREFGRRGESP